MVKPEKVRLEPFFTTSAACCRVMRLLVLMRTSLKGLFTAEDAECAEEKQETN
jgi:hypothetical protein